ncbi:MAG TPA: class I SAM-dependent methyltransferase [Polyangiales bacterium]
MALGRRKVALADQGAWVFNRMAHVYDARPPYPSALIDTIAELGTRVLDLGAGIGHLSIPLAARGHRVTAVEPALEMLARLRAPNVEKVHAQAESLPFEGPFDVAVIADALHFVDAERTGLELARVRAQALAIVRVELAKTPYMDALVALMHESAPRRARKTDGNAAQVASIAGLTHRDTREFSDHHPLSHEAMTRLLASISFLGPAMNEQRSALFRTRVAALGPATFSRRFTLHVYR